jgi:hypothetical protein
VREADLGAVHGAIADGFDEDEGLFEARVEDESLEGVLRGEGIRIELQCLADVNALTCSAWRVDMSPREVMSGGKATVADQS